MTAPTHDPRQASRDMMTEYADPDTPKPGASAHAGAKNRPVPYTNPVHGGGLGDPFVFRVAGRSPAAGGSDYARGADYTGGTYYAVGTADDGRDSREGAIPLLRSADLVHWDYVGRALRPPENDNLGPFWAPEVAEDGGRFFLYYSAGLGGHEGHVLRVATADAPEGPYRDTGRPLIDRARVPFSIDPHPFRDDDGQWYLFYARDFLDTEGGARAGTALVVDRLVDGLTRLAGEERTVLRSRCDWQLYKAQRTMYGKIFDWHTLEGPCVRKRDGRYYCLYSGGCFENATYGVDFATAAHPLGPWRGEGSEAGPRVLKTVAGVVIGPGHCSVVPGPGAADDGRNDYLVYHAWGPDMTVRRMCVDRLRWTAEGPRCDGPTWTPQALGGE